MGRATQGVRLIRLDGDDQIASVARVEKDESTDSDSIETSNQEGTASGNSEDQS